MPLNLILPSVIPALSTDGLLKLISDPKAASALWEQYKQARADYEAQGAAVEALANQSGEAQSKLAKDLLDYDAQVKAFNKAQNGFDQEVKNWDVEKAKWLQKVNEKNADAEAKLAEWWKMKDALLVEKNDFEAEKTKFATWAAVQVRGDALKQADLNDREAAVAAREAKADALSALLKQV